MLYYSIAIILLDICVLLLAIFVFKFSNYAIRENQETQEMKKAEYMLEYLVRTKWTGILEDYSLLLLYSNEEISNGKTIVKYVIENGNEELIINHDPQTIEKIFNTLMRYEKLQKILKSVKNKKAKN